MSVRKHSQDLLNDGVVTPGSDVTERDLAGDAQWKVIQKNTFTRWTNEHLKTVNKHVVDLETDLSDGLRFIALVEVLSGKRFMRFNKRPTIRSQKLENVTLALEFLQNEEGIKIVNIDSAAIVDCKLKLILGLIWTLILHYSISMPVWEDQEKKTEQTPKQRLLGWVLGKVPDVPVKNFTTDWNDGRAIGALVDGVAPGLCPDWDSWNPKDAIPNATEAMTAAEQWLEVPQLIKPAEMCNPKVDELSMMTYLSQFPSAKLKPGAPLRPKTNPARVRAYGPGLESEGHVGAAGRFTVETFSAGRGELDIKVVNPQGAQEQCEIVFNKDRNLTYSCSYTPTMEGTYKVIIKFANQEIPKSPFTTVIEGMAGDASKVQVSGPGIEKTGVIAKKLTYFEVHTKNAGMGAVDVVILDFRGHKDTIAPTVRKVSDDLTRVEYLAPADGLHSVNVFFAGKAVKNSPFGVTVAPTVDARKCFVSGRGVQANGVRIGDGPEFKVHTEGAGEGELKVQIVGPDNTDERATIKKVSNSVYKCNYEPKHVGEHVINVTYGGQHVMKSPFMVEVGPARPSKIRAYGPGLSNGVNNHPANFTVETNGETGALGFSIEGPSQAKIECNDNGDGSALIIYHPTEPGEYAIHILCDDEDIQHSPWMAEIQAEPSHPFHPSKVRATGVDTAKKFKVNHPVEFTMNAKDAGEGDLHVAAFDDANRPLETVVKDNKDGTYVVKFIPNKAVKHVVVATFGGAAIPNFPLTINVEEAFDPKKVKMYGPALERSVKVNQPAQFTVDLTESGPGEIAISLTDDANNDVAFETRGKSNNSFDVLFHPLRPGPHRVRAYANEVELPASPLRINVEDKFDAKKVKTVGAGLKTRGVKASLPSTFTVDASDAGEANLDVSLQDPEGVTTWPEVREEAPGKFAISYTPEKVGDYQIPVKYGGNHVTGSPFNVKVEAAGDASKVKFIDAIDDLIEMGADNVISLDTSKAGSGKVTCHVTDPTMLQADVHVVDNNNGRVTATYVPTKPGVYQHCVRYGGDVIPGGKFAQEALYPGEYNERLEKIKNEAQLRADKVDSTHSRGGRSSSIDEPIDSVDFTLPIADASNLTAEVTTPSGRRDTPDFQVHNNQIKVFYTPKEYGLHSLSLTADRKPVGGSPFQFYVGDPRQELVTAKGAGLSHGVEDEPCEFDVSTKNAGPGNLSVIVEGPSHSNVTCTDDQQGNCHVVYVPTEAGNYRVVVKHADKHIAGSPFTAKIAPNENRVRSQAASVTSRIPLKISEDEMKLMTASVRYPSGSVEPAILKRLDDGQLGVGFTPVEAGEHSVEIMKLGKPVSGSPFKIHISEAEVANSSMVKVHGNGLHQGFVNIVNEFFINTKDAGYGGLSLSIEGPSKADMEVVELSEGLCSVKYQLSEPGNYVVNVQFSEKHVPGSPFVLKVDGPPGLKSKEILNQRRLADTANVGTDCELSLKIPGTELSQLEALVRSPSQRVQPCEVKQLTADHYSIQFVPKEMGVHTVSVRHNGLHIPGSPFQFTVGPITEGGAHKVRAIGPGLEKAEVALPSFFNIYTREAGAGTLSIAMEGPAKADIDFQDNREGTCEVSYKCSEPGDYMMHIKFNDEHIADSPFKINVTSAGGYRRTNIQELQNHGCMVNVPTAFTLDTSKNPGRLDARILAPSGFEDAAIVEQIDPNHCTVRFTPRENGLHQIFVRQNGTPISGSPFRIIVGNVDTDPSMVHCYGEGLLHGQTGEDCGFTVDTSKAGAGMLVVTVDGPSKVNLTHNESPQGYRFNYHPTYPGDYFITIKYGGSQIPGSPFKAKVIGGGGMTGRRANEQSQVVLETTTTSTRSKASSLTRHPSDATKVITRGPGLEKAAINQDATFTVDTSKAGHNMLLVGVMGPEIPCEEVNIKHNGAGQYTVVYRPGLRGEYILVVKWGEQHIPGSPFHIIVQ